MIIIAALLAYIVVGFIATFYLLKIGLNVPPMFFLVELEKNTGLFMVLWAIWPFFALASALLAVLRYSQEVLDLIELKARSILTYLWAKLP